MVRAMLQVADMSATAGAVIAAIVLLRLGLRRAPKRYSYALWAAAGFRLACPVSFESVFSFFNLRRMLPAQTRNVLPAPLTGTADTVQPNVTAVIPEPSAVRTVTAQTGGLPDGNRILACIWVIGMAVMVVYSLVTFFRLHRSLASAVREEGNVWLSDAVRSPFILGYLRPRIYLPFGLSRSEKEYVLAHERHHLRRGDHFVKLFAYALLTLHWFNPLVWLAFFLMNRDMEMSCDEAVLRRHDGIRRDYSMTLLSFAANRRFPHPSPLAFGEADVKPRIKNALRWRKPALWVCALSTIMCVVLTACFVADPVQTQGPTDAELYPEASYDHVCFTGGAVIAEDTRLSSHFEQGDFLKTIWFDGGPLAVFSEDVYLDTETGYFVTALWALPSEESTLFRDPEDYDHTVEDLTREELIQKFREASLSFWKNGEPVTVEEAVPEGMFRLHYCYDPAGEDDEVLFTVYECDGQPIWIAQGECLRIIELEPKAATLELEHTTFLYQVDKNGNIQGASVVVVDNQTGEVVAVTKPEEPLSLTSSNPILLLGSESQTATTTVTTENGVIALNNVGSPVHYRIFRSEFLDDVDIEGDLEDGGVVWIPGFESGKTYQITLTTEGEAQIAFSSGWNLTGSFPDALTPSRVAFMQETLDFHRDILTDYVQQASGDELPVIQEIEDLYSVWRWKDGLVLSFRSNTGMHFGLFYAPDDTPRSLTEQTEALQPSGDGWRWASGNDTGYVERLEENWFYFECVQLYG